MKTEMQQLEYNDVQAELASVIEQYGARTFLEDFARNYPQHHNEIVSRYVQIDHVQVPKLFQKY